MNPSRLHDRIGPFTAVPNRFISDPTIGHEAFRLFVILRWHTNTKTGNEEVFPDYETLKKETGVKHNKTVANALRELESKGWLERRKRFGKSTIYTLTIPSSDDVVENTSASRDDVSVCHGVTRQYVTPEKTNKKNLTRRTTEGATPVAVVSPTIVEVKPTPNVTVTDPLGHAFDRHVQKDSSESLLQKHAKSKTALDTALTFYRLTGIAVHSHSVKSRLSGAADVFEACGGQPVETVMSAAIRRLKASNTIITDEHSIKKTCAAIVAERRAHSNHPDAIQANERFVPVD